MKVVEILELSQKSLQLLQKSCIKVEDVQYLALYYDYVAMKNCKKAYVVSVLAEKYGISERKVYYLLRRLTKECKIGAAE